MEDEAESDIFQEKEKEERRELKVDGFVRRQEFALQERNILRQMREFCTYKSIKVDDRPVFYHE